MMVSSSRIKVYRILPRSRAVFGLRRSRDIFFRRYFVNSLESTTGINAEDLT